MSGVNKVLLIGRLGHDPESKFLTDGKAVANFSVATSEEWKDKNTGEKQERTEWHKIVAFGRLAEICCQYLTKGSNVFIDGRLHTRTWDGKDGSKKSAVEIVAQDVQFLSPGKKQDSNPKAQEASRPAPSPGPEETSTQQAEDDIPF